MAARRARAALLRRRLRPLPPLGALRCSPADRAGAFRFAPLGGDTFRAQRARRSGGRGCPTASSCGAADGALLVRSDAALHVLAPPRRRLARSSRPCSPGAAPAPRRRLRLRRAAAAALVRAPVGRVPAGAAPPARALRSVPAMPELPEVEVTRRRIAPCLVGRRIARVDATAAELLLPDPARRAAARARRPHGRRRSSGRGKYLVAALDDGSRLLLHLGMTGPALHRGRVQRAPALRRAARGARRRRSSARFEPDAHTHLRLDFDDEGPHGALPRRAQVRQGAAARAGRGERAARAARHRRARADGAGALRGHARPQRRDQDAAARPGGVAGIGNIYADEALFLAGVRPRRAARRVTRAECDAIAEAHAARACCRSIETGGSSISDYVAPDGADGAYQDERRVYAREGEPCRVCGAPIRRIVIGQRSAHYCPRCQR